MSGEIEYEDELGGFALIEVIGEGGMGVVWAAVQLALDRPVAVKVVRPELAGDLAFRERFLAEARVAASFDHPNVVSVYDAGDDDGSLYLAMALVEGTDLRAVLSEEGALDQASAVAVVEQAAQGLQAVHSAGLVHRDVKPANILVRGADGRVMLTDFGLARAVDASKMTRTGMIVGTLDYIAPEQIEGADLDARSDVYSLGAVLFEALTGEPPYRRDNAAAQIHAHINEPPPRPSDHDADLAPFDAVIERAMAKDPEDRFGDAGSLAKAARKALGGKAAPSPRFESTVAELSIVGTAGAAGAAAARARPGRQTRAGRTVKPRRGQTTTVAHETGPDRTRVALIAGAMAIAALAVIGLVVVALSGGSSDSPPTPAADANTTTQKPPGTTVTVEKTITSKESGSPSGSSGAGGYSSGSGSSGDDWPGPSGYTVVLASLGSRGEAEAAASRATNAGLDAGVLYSSDYSSLRPGYWVTFSGVFASQPQASRRALRAQELGYSDAYPRFVSK